MDELEFLVPEFEYQQKSWLWYIYFLLIVAILISFSILTNNYSFLGIIVLGAILILIRGSRKPGIVMVAIHEDGIYVQNKIYQYKDIKSFSILQIEDKYYFIFNPAGRFQAPLKIPIDNPEAIRSKLNNLLTEVEYQESLLEVLIRFLRL